MNGYYINHKSQPVWESIAFFPPFPSLLFPFFSIYPDTLVLPLLSQGASVFSLSDVVEMDALVSNLEALEMKEAGALILAWAAFLCLVSSLPGKEEHNVLMVWDVLNCYLVPLHSCMSILTLFLSVSSYFTFLFQIFRRLTMLPMFVKHLKLHH